MAVQGSPAATPTSTLSKAKKGKRKLVSEEAQAQAVLPQGPPAVPAEGLLPSLLHTFLHTLASVTAGTADRAHIKATFHFLQKFSELLNDLLSQLATRRFLRTYLDDTHALQLCVLLLQDRTARREAEAGMGMDTDGGDDDEEEEEEFRLLQQMPSVWR